MLLRVLKKSNFPLACAAHLYYNECVDTTIRNIDEQTYRALKAHAALGGKTIGEVLNEAIRCYLALPDLGFTKRGSLRELTPEEYPSGNERLSEEIDVVVYGT